jgi:hypothetical protein
MPRRNNKRRILAVDDEPDITFTVKTSTGLFHVDTFNDPELALSFLDLDSTTWPFLILVLVTLKEKESKGKGKKK